jgi:uncharacterized protein (DUF2252 family)
MDEHDESRRPLHAAEVETEPRHLTQPERRAVGKAARNHATLTSHRDFEPAGTRDPVGLLLAQAETRIPELVPVRHGRMLVSPFTYFRGAALPMAADLSTTPTSGLTVQLCGDAHLSNFGAFASPERRLVFDVNDFDETLPGPFEWDVKRLAASLEVATRDNGYPRKDRRKSVMSGVTAYRTAMRDFATMSTLDVWYAHLDIEETMLQFQQQIKPRAFERAEVTMAKIRARDSVHALAKLTTVVDGERRFISNPPLIVPVEELLPDVQVGEIYAELNKIIHDYQLSLPSDRRHLLSQFQLRRMARKVVGVGSVGTRAWVLLMESDDGQGPLILQAKEAQKSVLADYVGPSTYDNQGQRVVAGQHLMQAVSDIFLGWQSMQRREEVRVDYYLRQLRDGKYSVPIDQVIPSGMLVYARLCGWTLARAHARSGDRIAISAYLGKSDKFDNAVADFAETYADQNERDYAAFADSVASGRTTATPGV